VAEEVLAMAATKTDAEIAAAANKAGIPADTVLAAFTAAGKPAEAAITAMATGGFPTTAITAAATNAGVPQSVIAAAVVAGQTQSTAAGFTGQPITPVSPS